MSLNLKLLRGYKNVICLWKPATQRSNLTGRAAILAKHKSLIENETIRALSTTSQRQQHQGPLNSCATGAETHWTAERLVSIALLAFVPASLLLETSAADYLLTATLVIHSHWGLQAILTDYVHGKTLPKIAHAGLYLISTLVFAGLCYFNYNDIGISKAVKKLWAL
jgi:succinate dehydrogenase (ubiquinone) membrane anchor subunit